MTLPHITLDSGPNPDHSIIWLHGLGADGHDFAPVAQQLSLPAAVRFIFPHAPTMPVTVNGGYVMPAWYDIAGTTLDSRQDEPGIRRSQRAVEALIAQEVARGVPARRIFLAGFSQGGAIALHTALRLNTPLAGALALSTYLPLAGLARGELACNATPVFMAHGTGDGIVPHALGVASRDALRSLGCTVDWRDYAMQHSVCGEELADIQDWLAARIG